MHFYNEKILLGLYPELESQTTREAKKIVPHYQGEGEQEIYQMFPWMGCNEDSP